MDHTIDLMHHAILGWWTRSVYPGVCAQTSIITRGDTDSNQTDPLPDWRGVHPNIYDQGLDSTMTNLLRGI
jgi:hypothetical protein